MLPKCGFKEGDCPNAAAAHREEVHLTPEGHRFA